MNLAGYIVLMVIGGTLWLRSGVSIKTRQFWVGFGTLFVIWWVIWGQIAVSDGWWLYSSGSLSLGHLGAVPAADLFYFLGGLGWFLYLCRKLDFF